MVCVSQIKLLTYLVKLESGGLVVVIPNSKILCYKITIGIKRYALAIQTANAISGIKLKNQNIAP